MVTRFTHLNPTNSRTDTPRRAANESAARHSLAPSAKHCMDTLTPEARSRLMSRIRGKDTKPELVVRSILHRMGYRFRLHRKDLPGRPDVVLPRHKKVVLVHGCFWHGHLCKIAPGSKSNKAYWSSKIEANRARDERNRAALTGLGWDVLELWECEIRNAQKTEERLRSFMRDAQATRPAR